MEEVDIPFTDEKIDPEDPSGSAVALVTTTLGFGLLALMGTIALTGSNKAQDMIQKYTGYSVSGAEDNGIDVV
jgi:hypothetical protein